MSRAGPLTGAQNAEVALAEMEEQTAGLQPAGRGALGVVGRFELGPMSGALQASHLGWYPLVAISVLGGVDVLFAAALLDSGGAISYSLGIPNLVLLLYIRILGLGLAGVGVLRLSARGTDRSRLARVGGVLAATGLLATGVARNPWSLVGATLLASLGSGVTATLLRPLLFDHYRPEVRVRALAAYVGGLMIGLSLVSAWTPLADALGLTWRSEFLVLAAVAGVGVASAGGLSDPVGGGWEARAISRVVQRQLGPPGSADVNLEDREVALTVAERFRQLFTTRAAVPLLFAASAFGLVLVSLPPYLVRFWRDRWGMGPDAGTGLLSALCLVTLAGLVWFGRRGELAFRAAPGRMLRMAGRVGYLGAVSIAVAVFIRAFAVMVVLLAVAFTALTVVLVAASVALLVAVRPANRPHTSLALGAAVLQGGLTGNFLMQAFASRFGLRWAFLVVGLFVLAAAGATARAARALESDLDDTVSALIQETELRARVSRGQHLPLLGVRHADFSYGPVQVLFDVNFTVDDGEMVALLGTNGAGKSTLLRVISGICLPARGSVQFRGTDVTHLGPDERVRLGISQVPGGRAIFGPMTVTENLRVFGYTHGRDRRAVEAGVEAGLAAFPSLAARADHLAATLSGGEQQMLGIAKAFVVRPRILLIDEVSLGLAPVVVGQLLETVRGISAGGTAVVIVEQSVNIALALVDHAYFMEKGEIRFDGPAAELAGRPDLLRSVFLEGAAARTGTGRRRVPSAGRSVRSR